MLVRKLLLPFLIAGTIFPPASAQAIDQSKFHMVVPAQRSQLDSSRQSPFWLEFRDTDFTDMKALIERCRDAGILPNFEQKPPVLYIYLPSVEMYMRERSRLAREARRQFQALYPNADIEVKIRVMRTNINVTYMYRRLQEQLETFRARFKDDQQAQEYVDAMEAASEAAFTEANRRSLDVTATVARRWRFSLAGARFLIVGGARTLQTLPALAQGGVPAAAAVALIATDATVEFFNVAFTQKIQRWFQKWPFRFQSSVLQSRVSHFVNNAIWNFGLFSVGRPLAMQALANVSDPDIPAPSVDTAMNLIGWSSIGVLFYTAFTNGYNTLRDKGWVSSSQIDVTLQISGLFDLATSILNSNPNWYYYRFFTWGPQWSFYLLVGVLAQIAPVRADKILAVESTIEDWRDIHEEHVADASWHVRNEKDFSAALTRIGGCENRLRVEEDNNDSAPR